MKASRIVYALLFCMAGMAFADQKEAFVQDLSALIKDPECTEKTVNDFIREYSTLLLPHSDVQALSARMQGLSVEPTPLEFLKSMEVYKTVVTLIDSGNENLRFLFYCIVAAANDTRFFGKIVARIDSEKKYGNKFWAIMALLYLRYDDTDVLFDLMVKYENFGDAHMLPLFYQLDKTRLQGTAFKKMGDDRPMAKILAASVLGQTGYSQESERLLRAAVTEWPMEIKGYAINGLIGIGAGNLLPLMRPLLTEKATAQIAFVALAGSPTREDRGFAMGQITGKEKLTAQDMNALLESNNQECIRLWLGLLAGQKVPVDYYFSVMSRKILFQPDMAKDIVVALKNITNPKFLAELVRALEGKYDDATTGAIIVLLQYPDSTVRYWAATALQGNNNPLVAPAITRCLNTPTLRTAALIDLIIENRINTLHKTFEEIWSFSEDGDLRWKSLAYLSEFPLPVHRDIFVKVLNEEDMKTHWSWVRLACMGLARLKDNTQTEKIGEIMQAESRTSLYNIRTYLQVLDMIHSVEAKKILERYQNVNDDGIRETVLAILKKW